MKFRDKDLAQAILSAGVKHYEHLGICIAAFVGGAAIAKHASTVFPVAPAVAIGVGFLTSLSGLFLAVLVAFDSWMAIKVPSKYAFWGKIAIAPVLIGSVFFVIAGSMVAIKQITS